MNALVKTEAHAITHSFEMMERMAHAIAKSGLFGMKSIDQALALMLVAQAEGQHPATITQEYDIIQNKAARKTHSVLARFQAAGGKVEWHELSHTKADATFTHNQGGSVRLDWTLEQAHKAGLAGKDNWKNYGRAMLRARVIAEGIRAVYPAALGGMLVVEEAQDLAPAPAAATGEPKNMGPAEVVEPTTYPHDAFDANLPKWREVIASGRKTADQIIAMAQTKHPLTDAQKAAVKAPAAPAAETAGTPTMTAADVQRQMDAATDVDALNEAAALIEAIADAAAREALSLHYDVRLAEMDN